MKLINIDISRLTALLDATRPAGQTYLPKAIAALIDRYNFASGPSSYEDMVGDRIDFKQGEFEGSGIQTLELYSDGIVISSRSNTDFIDKFFADMMEWSREELGVNMIKTHPIDRLYDSNLVVETDKDILKPLSAVEVISKMVQDELQKTTGIEVNFEPLGWALTADQTKISSLKPSSFRIERKIGRDFSLNQFVTSAPLKTSQHMAVLEKLESLV